MITKTLTQGIGYSGKTGAKCYIARIVGTSQTYGLDREFVEATSVERDSFTKSKYTRTYTYELTHGLYEISSRGERSYIIVWEKDGADVRTAVTMERVEAMARLLSQDEPFEVARLATKPATTGDVK